VLDQTYRNFELIIINDGSTDDSEAICKGFDDPRIIYMYQENVGLAATLNRGISLARGQLIARMDNDDLCLPARFSEQVQFLEDHPRIQALGTWATVIDENDKDTGRYHDHLTGSFRIKYYLLFNNPFVHSSMMIRKSILKVTGAYSLDRSFFEDHNLWSRMARVAELDNLPRRLLKYREVSSGMSKTTGDYFQRVINQSCENILWYCPKLQVQMVRSCVSLLNGVTVTKDYRRDLAEIRHLLREINSSFSKRENVPIRMVRKESFKQELNFRRHYYNSIIERTTSGSFEKLLAVLKRKILFVRYKKHLV
jgi:glycosyltransferase involved in cell wall biosynthesis